MSRTHHLPCSSPRPLIETPAVILTRSSGRDYGKQLLGARACIHESLNYTKGEQTAVTKERSELEATMRPNRVEGDELGNLELLQLLDALLRGAIDGDINGIFCLLSLFGRET
eukprot:TRINITY_DN28570_c0_g1_i1.p1 TRINITY_DN28570_c0_g1~~TRINITY_DN28570_c0_g1_i1.p1  ORF type:complete len:113 (+),score=11.71 TRINITY_DN28570_c0_g1_i1:170-508(+)